MRSVYVIHVVLFLLAFALRVGLTEQFVGLRSEPKGEANPDQLDYERLAYHLSIGEGYVIEPGTPTACRPPGTSFLLAPVYLLFGHSYLAGRLWFCGLSAVCCLIVGWIGHRLAGRMVGLLASAWLAFYPGHAYYAIHFLSETPTTLFTALAIAFQLYSWRKPGLGIHTLIGVTWGLAILIRPNLAIAAGISGLLILRQHKFRNVLAFAGALLLIVVPWVWRNQIVMGKPTFCTIVGGFTFWGAHNPIVASDPNLYGYWVSASTLIQAGYPLEGSEIEREELAWKYARTFIREHPERLPILKLHALLRVVWAYSEAGNALVDTLFRISWILSLPLVMVGLIQLCRRSKPETILLLTPLITVLGTALVFYGCSRFRDSAAPVLAVLAAVGVVTIVEWGSRRFVQPKPG